MMYAALGRSLRLPGSAVTGTRYRAVLKRSDRLVLAAAFEGHLAWRGGRTPRRAALGRGQARKCLLRMANRTGTRGKAGTATSCKPAGTRGGICGQR